MLRTIRFTAALTVALLAASAIAADGPREDWPKWLGPQGTGISPETGLAEQWPRNGPKQLWGKTVGLGHSSPVAVDGRVYLFHLVGNQDNLTCFDADTGNVIWNQAYNAGWTGAYKGTRATPTIEKDEGRIYTFGGTGQLVCRELETGKPVWSLDVLKATGGQPLQWGQASSPLMIQDRIFVQGGDGGALAVCVDKKSGHVLWLSQARDKAGYAQIISVDPGNKPQLVVLGGRAIYGLSPRDGRTIWEEPWVTQYDVNAAIPVYREGNLFITSEYGHGCAMLQLDGQHARKLWEKKDVQSKMQPPILDGDVVYANSSGKIKCLSWPDGKVIWEAKDRKLDLGAGGTMLRVGDKLITLSERGVLSLVQATPQGVKLLAQHQQFDAREAWSTPLLYGGRLYAKGGEEFVCLDVGGK